ncbi:hypothetical protein ABB37_09781 [Leptomonas pyrrhocoris]|uniref:Transmembrane protein n=1 Tax=Leptomonas pyrrhocoris TaxID=157538 RepID=A0A0M9FQ54_LEPPY|nr:hypothetical protein ABB37_09781 [Leptomonas pyrrhocoris]KPA73649.1 hypothetical protein ABB37_09781 [Leptomonas pyrrhocoris]|eukprot:XP_015652088.1 hypothetical protein ABB37_09781 [Leptomonas pyrrhocoris]
MPYADPAFLAQPRGSRGNGSSASLDIYDVAYRTPRSEDVRSPVSPHEEDLHMAAPTAPLLSPTTAAAGSDHHHSHPNGSNLHTRSPSPQQRSLSSPSTNPSVCVTALNRLLEWPPHAAAAAAAATTPDAVRLVDNVSFTSVVPHSIHDDSPRSPTASATVPAKSPSHAVLRCLLSTITPSIDAFRARLRDMTWKRILWVVLLVALVMVGNFMQIVMLNFWLISFPADGTPGNYTAFAVPGIFFAILFVLLFGAYAALRRPSLRFATHLHGWAILAGVGFCDAINSWMATYAATYTSEVLQALFTNLCPLYAVFLAKWILRDTRRYANVYITSVFVLTICGILAASLYGLIRDRNVSEGKWWILIFSLSMPVRVLMNVWQSLYMIVYTRDPNFVSWLRVRFAEEEEGETPAAVDTEGDHITPKTAAVRDLHGGCADPPSHPSRGAQAPDSAATSLDNSCDDDLMNEKANRETAARMTCNSGRHTQDELECKDEVDEAQQHRHKEEDLALVLTSDLDSDSAVPTITITAPTPALHEHPPPPPPPQQQQRHQVRYDGAFKAAPSTKHAVLGVADDGGEDVLPPLASDAPAVAGHADTFGVGREGEGEDDVFGSTTAAAVPPLPTQTLFTVRYHQGEDTIVKLVMLAGETFLQMCFTLALLPADALPWWGNSATVSATWDNFREGLRCVFTIQENFLYCFLYTLGFVFTYVGCAYLNHYSAALCSIVSQLSSPVTALMLVIVPSWNVQDDGDSPWYCNVVAIVFLAVAALLYVLWEEMTDHEKMQTEYALKMEELHVRPASHEKPHSLVING